MPIRAGLLGLLVLLAFGTSAQARTLKIFTWEDYFHPELLRAFEERYQVTVEEVLYSSDVDRSRRLAQADGGHFDIVVTAGSDLRMHVENGWIMPIDFASVPNAEELSSQWRNAYFGSRVYALPYVWGTTGIAYRADLVKEPITRWAQLFWPAAELQGRILLTDDVGELINVGLKAQGYSLNTQNEQSLIAVEEMLLEQRPYVQAYRYVLLDERSELLSGEAVAAFTYNGDALVLQQENANVHYVVPEEGSNLWADYLTVGAHSENPILAHVFLNFINDPVNAAKTAQYYQFATPHMGAYDLLPQDFLDNSLIYPDRQVLERSEFSRALSPEILQRRHQIESSLVSEGEQ